MYLSDDIPVVDDPTMVLLAETRRYLWARWDQLFATYRVKLKWGPFRPSFRIGVLFEPILVKYIGPRP